MKQINTVITSYPPCTQAWLQCTHSAQGLRCSSLPLLRCALAQSTWSLCRFDTLYPFACIKFLFVVLYCILFFIKPIATNRHQFLFSNANENTTRMCAPLSQKKKKKALHFFQFCIFSCKHSTDCLTVSRSIKTGF